MGDVSRALASAEHGGRFAIFANRRGRTGGCVPCQGGQWR